MTREEIRALRGELGLTQQELAIELRRVDPNIRATAPSISRWEAGGATPNAYAEDALIGVAMTLGLPAKTETIGGMPIDGVLTTNDRYVGWNGDPVLVDAKGVAYRPVDLLQLRLGIQCDALNEWLREAGFAVAA